MKIKYFLQIVIIIFFASCINKKEYINFVKRETKTVINLRTDGYYYYEEYSKDQIYDKSNDLLKNKNLMHPIILYKDGTLKYCMWYPIENTEDINLRHKSFTNTIKNVEKEVFNETIISWGHYKIDKDTIIIRYYWHGPNPFKEYLVEKIGNVLNDTTFILKKAITVDKNAYCEDYKPEIYKFRHFSPKPDSTNKTFDFKNNLVY